MQYCESLAPIINLIKHGLIPVLQIGIPLILIVYGMLDLGKAVIASKEDEVKKSQQMLIKRVIYAVAVFFVVFIVQMVFTIVAGSTSGTEGMNNWFSCWSQY